MLSSANILEDKHMDITNGNIEHNNELNTAVIAEESTETTGQSDKHAAYERSKIETASAPSEDLLMYLAKQNVARRYDLIRHIILFPVTFIVLAMVTNGFRFTGMFYVGFFCAWGLLIAYKIYVVVRAWLIERPNATKVDYVQAEYERLKNTPPEKIRM